MDDVGAVLQRLVVQLPYLLQAFELLGMAAGTSLNVAKCLIIPLWGEPLLQAAQRIRRIFPQFSEVRVAWSGKLLGIIIGPGAGRASWFAPLLKLERRIPVARGLKLGLGQTLYKYNQIAYSTLNHTACFYTADQKTLKQEHILHQRIPGAPRYAFTTDLLEGLDEVGFRSSISTLRCQGAAAQWRCMNFTSSNFWKMWQKLHQCDDMDDLGEGMWLYPKHRDWIFKNSIMAQSVANHYRLEGIGVKVPCGDRAVRRGVQRAAARTIRASISRELPIQVLLRKISMRLHVNMAGEEERIKAICLNIGKFKQAFLAAVVKTWVGAWCVAHRFTHEARGPCAFGCGCVHGDHPIHYCMCEVYLAMVQQIAPRLRDTNTEGLPFAALCLRKGACPAEQRAWAVFLYVIFTTYEGLRSRRTLRLHRDEAFRALVSSYNLLTVRSPGLTVDVRRFQR